VAQKIETLLIDDLVLCQTDGEEEAPADETIEFGLDGKRWKIDLAKNNAEELRILLEPYIQAASQKLPAVNRTSRTSARRQHSAEIRRWANEMGIPVSERGRIPEDVVRQYEQNH
jgi:hypothetical protein